ncbi:endonuclease III domain-containing protein [Weissella halotolerans]|uniref:HhH-GPD domain-containing protein n=1 Tax=Weissella halotolerans DSM 20190 TaxID=1123500 RepID=A0A0R2GA19_9LACO|nr:endonuclease III [Weissella halotolerans]KRN33549.1 hypothetical protein IV68_GL000355 [Weissella halotolerans DSM 20190]
MEASLKNLYDRLYTLEGPQGWWPATDPIEISLGAILVQNTAWANVEKALTKFYLKTNFAPNLILELELSQLERLIQASGFYKTKALAIQALLTFYQQDDFDVSKLKQRFGDNLRRSLLELPGIGPETADVLLVYVFDQVVFIPDTYTRRLLSILFNQPIESYQKTQQAFPLPTDFTSDQAKEFHGLLDTFGKRYLQQRRRTLTDEEIRQLFTN